MSEAPISTIAEINPPLPRFVADDEIVSFVRMPDVRETGGLTGYAEARFGEVKAGFTRFAEGDVLFAKITPCMENGKGAQAHGLLNGIGCGSTEFHVLRAKDGNDGAFIFQVTQSKAFRQKAETAMSGSAGQQRVQADFFRNHLIYIPAPTQQRRIAEILGSVDEAIEATEALIAKQQQVKAGLMHDLFTRGLTPDGQLRPPPSTAPALYHETPLGLLPKDWTVRPLADFTQHDITYGIVQAGPHVDGGVPYVRTGDMSGDALVREEMLCTSPAIAGAYRRSEIREGEIVCAIRATVGKVLLVPPELHGANLTQGTARISPNSRIDKAFLLWAMRDERSQREISLRIKGTTFMEITLGDLRGLPIAAPTSKDEQREIGVRMNAANSALAAEAARLAKLRQQKQGLMQALLTPPGGG
jgi:type I restriction enzyme S subunit